MSKAQSLGVLHGMSRRWLWAGSLFECNQFNDVKTGKATAARLCGPRALPRRCVGKKVISEQEADARLDNFIVQNNSKNYRIDARVMYTTTVSSPFTCVGIGTGVSRSMTHRRGRLTAHLELRGRHSLLDAPRAEEGRGQHPRHKNSSSGRSQPQVVPQNSPLRPAFPTFIPRPPLVYISYAKVPNKYGPYAYCGLDTGVACA